MGFTELWSDQKPWWNSYLTPVMNLGEVRRAQLAKSTLLTSTLVPLGSFKDSSVAEERVGCGKQREATAPIQLLVKLQRWFLSLRWKTCLRKNCWLRSCACSDGPALRQNTLMMINIIIKKGKWWKMLTWTVAAKLNRPTSRIFMQICRTHSNPSVLPDLDR